MSEQIVLPDRLHIEQLRKRLWRDREYGQAAVMIGAGFSRNAEKLSGGIPPFPLWGELARAMHEALYLPAEGAGVRISPAETLRLASEYETAFGRSALDDLLLRTIPDTSYHPGQLHGLLLSLPWADVFTTNYDTLLERTLPSIHDRKYDVVQTARDIPVMAKPRIVKLHGSFPAHRPFVITEEDYRTYPSSFPPFVNLVQQSIMENVFCLIGFSGDDPNFLYWTGWVRDNLGEATPPIYLCGLLDLSVSQRKLLEKRFVIPIDLSPLLAHSEFRESPDRHAIALRWFLETLRAGEPQSPKEWPEAPAGVTPGPVYDLPPVLPGPRVLPAAGEPDPPRGPDAKPAPDDLRALLAAWRSTRACYPGWVVLPRDNRESLLWRTKPWVPELLDELRSLAPPDDLLLLHEFNWRLERTLTPISDEWVETFRRTVLAYDPYPRPSAPTEAAFRPDRGEAVRWANWEEVRGCWVDLAFALARKARESQDTAEHELWMERLRPVAGPRPELKARWHHEKCLFHLFRLEQEQLRAALNEWPPSADLPFWEARRAAILAELGDLKEAERIAAASLNEIRASIQPSFVDYSVLSKEGWVMLLLDNVKTFNESSKAADYTSRLKNRWEKLRAYRCDPSVETEVLISVVRGSDLKPHAGRGVKKKFDPGHIVRWEKISGEPRYFRLQPAFAFLRLFEEAALPMRFASWRTFHDAVSKAAGWVVGLAPLWSLTSLLRVNDEEAIDERFDRVRIATMSDQEVAQYYQLLIGPFRQAVKYFGAGRADAGGESNLLTKNVELLSDLISRLCIRLPTEQLYELLTLTCEVYGKQGQHFNHLEHERVQGLFQRILFSLPDAAIIAKMPELLALPFLAGRQPEDEWWRMRDPFRFIVWQRGTRLDPGFDRSSWDGPVARLLRIAGEPGQAARARAIDRLLTLHQLGALTEGERRAFGEALWARVGESGLPADTGVLASTFLRLPEPSPGRAAELFRRHLTAADFSQGDDYFREWLNSTAEPGVEAGKTGKIDWGAEEVARFVENVAGWWDANKAQYAPPVAPEGDEDEGDSDDDYSFYVFYHFYQAVARVALRRLGGLGGETKATLGRVLAELDAQEGCGFPASPLRLALGPGGAGEAAAKLRAGLYSIKELNVRFSVYGLHLWLSLVDYGVVPAPPGDLLNALVGKVVTRGQPGLLTAINHTGAIIGDHPSHVGEGHVETLCIALGYLAEETRLPKDPEQGEGGPRPAVIPVDDRPEYRASAAGLARQLFGHFQARGAAAPEAVLMWKELSLADPLPEVRRAWW